MTTQDREMARRALDRRLSAIRPLSGSFAKPAGGWIKAIREALGMSGDQLAQRIGKTRFAVRSLEQQERNEGIRLSSLRRAAEALDCRLVYAFVPNDSLEDMVGRRAELVARRRLVSVQRTMALEDQALEDDELDAQVTQLAHTLINSRDLWAEQ